MFHKILIANRGEIACRVIKTAKKMGISTVAIYSHVDKNALHVQQADEAFGVGESPAINSYLNIDAIIQAAITSGAKAIHPGYGFLSENTEFAKACAYHGITFIGPSVNAMLAMASKQLAKQQLEKSGIPLTPGYHGDCQSEQRLLEEARLIGFPVLLKAANGGGGKGMRAVYSESDFLSALAAAKRESLASFADDTMIIEKLVLNPRHIEVQIMADNHGGVVHLFERDCSIQRRHQKIIEEAPAPGLSSALRQRLSEAACEVARSIDYRGAGTVEFLVDNHEQFYFMEMNTRLQVEHPVTEMITGLDLVEWQIKIAANHPLPLQQHDITQHGHAIECRIYAEDPRQQFIPSIGQLHVLKEPQGEGIRIDTGVTQGSSISQYYDPMIAKLIAYGDTRESALQRLDRALKHYVIGGVKTNIVFLQAICEHPRFKIADLSTDFLTSETIILSEPDAHLALLVAASYDYLALTESHQDSLLKDTFAWQMHLASSWTWRYVINKESIDIDIIPLSPNQLTLTYNDKSIALTISLSDERLTICYDNQTQTLTVDNQLSGITVYLDNGSIPIERFSWESIHTNSQQNNGQLTAPMPATIVAILKKAGESIKKNDPLMILEAMKMEHTISAPHDGIIASLLYEVGQQVSEGTTLLTLNHHE